MSEVLKISSPATAAVIYPTPVTDKLPLNLKELVQELFEQDKLAGSLDRDIKQVKARYHQLILRKSDKTYTDSEILAIKKVHDELTELQARKAAFQVRKTEIKAFLTTLIAPLGGGRWIHETDDFMNPHWEFWLEDEELKYARLKSEL